MRGFGQPRTRQSISAGAIVKPTTVWPELHARMVAVGSRDDMPMLNCESCGASLRTAIAMAGKRVRCPKCGHVNPTPGSMSESGPVGPLRIDPRDKIQGNARRVRSGAAALTIVAWLLALAGAILLAIAILGAAAIFGGGSRTSSVVDVAAFGLWVGYLFPISVVLLVAGFFLGVFASYVRLMSLTCEAVTDAISYR